MSEAVPLLRATAAAPASGRRRRDGALSPDTIEHIDRGGMLDDVLAQADHLRDALGRVDAAGIPESPSPGGLAVCGMGGSAIGGDLAIGALGVRATRPIRVLRGYAPEPWARDDALFLLSSYSGDTEETLACFHEVGALGADRVVLTCGGRLGAAARASGVPVIEVPRGLQPRAAVAYMTVAALECAAACGAAPSVRRELHRAAGLLERVAAGWGPDSPEHSQAKSIARRLYGKIAVVYGAEATAATAFRWKNQLNENAKVPAFASVLPEADHNELCGYEGAHAIAPLHPIFLEDRDQSPQIRRRVDLTAASAEGGAAGVSRVAVAGETPLERTLSLVLLGDLVSVYLAVLGRVDPTPVDALVRLKRALG